MTRQGGWRRGLGLLAAIGLGIAAGCGDAEPSDGTPQVVATTGIWADVVSNVACDGLAGVEALVPAGADPHGFEPSLADRGRLGKASLVVSNGLGLEESLQDTLDAVGEEGVPVFVVADSVDDTRLGGGSDSDDPHIWFDPRRVASAMPGLADALVQVGLDRAAVQACVDDYLVELGELDAEVERILDSVPARRRTLVTNHDSLGYLAERYGYEILGTVIRSRSSLAQTNPEQLERLAMTIRRNGVPAIFAEAQESNAEATAVAQRVGGVKVITLYSGALGAEGSGAETYVGLMLTDARLIADGLS